MARAAGGGGSFRQGGAGGPVDGPSKEHPGITLVTRDRAETYAQGIREGAPEAVQVADRWHLLKVRPHAFSKSAGEPM